MSCFHCSVGGFLKQRWLPDSRFRWRSWYLLVGLSFNYTVSLLAATSLVSVSNKKPISLDSSSQVYVKFIEIPQKGGEDLPRSCRNYPHDYLTIMTRLIAPTRSVPRLFFVHFRSAASAVSHRFSLGFGSQVLILSTSHIGEMITTRITSTLHL